MSVIVMGMEMPKGCLSCFVKAGWCPAIRKRMEEASRSDRWIPENYRHDDCPLIEVQEPGTPENVEINHVESTLEIMGYNK